MKGRNAVSEWEIKSRISGARVRMNLDVGVGEWQKNALNGSRPVPPSRYDDRGPERIRRTVIT